MSQITLKHCWFNNDFFFIYASDHEIFKEVQRAKNRTKKKKKMKRGIFLEVYYFGSSDASAAQQKE
jgi:hypothetical protein